MTSKPLAKKWIVLGIAFAALVFGWKATAWSVEQRAIRNADDAAHRAVNATTPFDVDAAKRWLESNGYEMVWWNPHHPRGFIAIADAERNGLHSLSVVGQRRIGLFNGDTWMQVQFEFKADGTFIEVNAERWPMRIRTSRLTSETSAASPRTPGGLAE